MSRHQLLYALLLTILIAGCGRQSDTNDPAFTEPDSPPPVDQQPAPERPTPDQADIAALGNKSSEMTYPRDLGELICTPKWFTWVNEQVIARYNDALEQLYPEGLPEVGSSDWFSAVDKATGGDGAHGPDGGSDEWCFMMQQRLDKDNPSP